MKSSTDLRSLTRVELRAFLDEKGVGYERRALKRDLVALAEMELLSEELESWGDGEEEEKVVGLGDVTSTAAAVEVPRVSVGGSLLWFTLCVWSLILAYSFVVSYLTGGVWWGAIVMYAAGLCAYFLWHWLAHQSFMGGMYRAHMHHHVLAHPVEHFCGRPRGAVAGAVPGLVDSYWLLWVFLAGLVAGAHQAGASAGVCVGSVVLYLVGGAVSGWLHAAVHSPQHRLDRYAWFRELRALHFVHHLGDSEHPTGVPVGLDRFFSVYASTGASVAAARLLAPMHRTTTAAEAGLAKAHASDADSDGDSDGDSGSGAACAEQGAGDGLVVGFGVPFGAGDLARATNAGALVAAVLGMELPAHVPAERSIRADVGRQQRMTWALTRGVAPVLVRMSLGAGVAWLWFLAQRWVQPHQYVELVSDSLAVGDRLHVFSYLWHNWIAANPDLVRQILIATSLLLDATVLGIGLYSSIGPTVRPMFSLCVLVGFRQVTQMLCELPPPVESLWGDPGFPTLFTSFETDNDFFYNLTVGVSLVGAVELVRVVSDAMRPVAMVVAIAVIVAQVTLLVVLRADWTISIVTGLFAGRVATVMAARFAPYVDLVLP